jgi:hypothetical protein
MQARLAQVKGMLTPLVQQELRALGQQSVEALSQAAPYGKSGGGGGLSGDAPGRLAESFYAYTEGLQTKVQCEQPHKLNIIVNGRGPVRPVHKKALYWQGLPHPVKYARATKPNDFVSPVVEEMSTEAAIAGERVAQKIVEALGTV